MPSKLKEILLIICESITKTFGIIFFVMISFIMLVAACMILGKNIDIPKYTFVFFPILLVLSCWKNYYNSNVYWRTFQQICLLCIIPFIVFFPMLIVLSAYINNKYDSINSSLLVLTNCVSICYLFIFNFFLLSGDKKITIQKNLDKVPIEQDKNRSKERDSKSNISMYNIQRPAGPLNAKADNYIDRDLDKSLFESIRNEVPSKYVIQGGFKTGKTSWILRCIHIANNNNWGIIHINFEEMIKNDLQTSKDKKETEKKLYKLILKEVCFITNEELDERECEIREPKDWAQNQLKNLLARNENDNYQCYGLIFDGVDYLYENDKLQASQIDNLMFFFSYIVTIQNTSKFMKKLKGIFITIGPWSFNAAVASKLIDQSSFNQLHFFSLEDTERLVEIINNEDIKAKKRVLKDAKRAHAFFGGQPYLLHKAIYEMSKTNKTYDDIRKEAESLENHYSRYWNKVLKVIHRFHQNSEWKTNSKLDYILNYAYKKNLNNLTQYGVYQYNFENTPNYDNKPNIISLVKYWLEKEGSING